MLKITTFIFFSPLSLPRQKNQSSYECASRPNLPSGGNPTPQKGCEEAREKGYGFYARMSLALQSTSSSTIDAIKRYAFIYREAMIAIWGIYEIDVGYNKVR